MKWTLTIAASATLGLLVSGWGYSRAVSWRPPSPPNAQAVIVSLGAPVAEVDPGAVYVAPGRGVLMDPGAALPQTHRHPLEALRRLRVHARSCRAEDRLVSPPSSLEKAAAWQTYRCGQGALPEGFFTRPPFIHPSGRSYVALAWSGRDAAWIEARLNEVHVHELSRAPEGVTLSAAQRALSSLTGDALAQVRRGDEAVVDRAYVWIRRRRQRDAYRVYPVDRWRGVLADAGLRFRPGTGACREEGVFAGGCVEAVESVPPARWPWQGIAGLCLATLVGCFVAMGLARRRDREAERARQKLALRTLAHELRTPATSLTLHLEPLRARFDDLPEACQDAFFSLCDDAQRLRRVLSACERYLRLRDETSDPLDVRELPSVNRLFSGLLDEHEQVILTPLVEDMSLRTDETWLRVCVQNLVENALTHGVPPAHITLRRGDGRRGAARLEVEVQDEGRVALSAALIEDPFTRGDESRGLGLGLGIVSAAAQALGGELRYTGDPKTTFTLCIEALPQ